MVYPPYIDKIVLFNGMVVEGKCRVRLINPITLKPYENIFRSLGEFKLVQSENKFFQDYLRIQGMPVGTGYSAVSEGVSYNSIKAKGKGNTCISM
jgi:hypothetical protein